MFLFDLLSYLISPPKCSSCGKTIELSFISSPLCQDCQKQLAEELLETCHVCKKMLIDCSCIPQPLADSGCLFHLKLFPYYAKYSERVGNRLIYEMKRSADPHLYDFLADKLCEQTKSLADKGILYCSADNAVLTYVPRSHSAVRKYGHDQAKLLATALSKRTGIPVLPIVKRGRRANAEMKKLSKTERLEKASEAYVETKYAQDLKGSFVIVVDDVVTSGASTLNVARVAMKNKAHGFGVVSVGASRSYDT